MGQQYLIDSNALIDYLSGSLPNAGKAFMDQVINAIPFVSVISKIEVLGYKSTEEASILLSGFLNDSIVINLQDEIVDKTIEIRKEYKIKTPDAIIAATAITCKFILISRNEKDFKNIQHLSLLNPHKIE